MLVYISFPSILLFKVSLADDNLAKNFLNILGQPKKYSATIKNTARKRHSAASNVLSSQEKGCFSS